MANLKGSDNPFPSILIEEATEPAAPAAGFQRLYIDSTSHTLYRTDSAGAQVAIEGSSAAVELDYVQITSNVSPTATTEGTANTVVTGSAIAYGGSTVVMLEFFSESVRPANTAAAACSLWLYDGSTSIGRIALVTNPAANTMGTPVHCFRRLTPSAATHTYSIRASVTSGTGLVSAGTGVITAAPPAFIRITRVI